jgi:hypothetical protein
MPGPIRLQPGQQVMGAGIGQSIIQMLGPGPAWIGPNPKAKAVLCPKRKHVIVAGGAELQVHQITVSCECGVSTDFP